MRHLGIKGSMLSLYTPGTLLYDSRGHCFLFCSLFGVERWVRVSWGPGWSWTLCVNKDELGLVTLLPPPAWMTGTCSLPKSRGLISFLKVNLGILCFLMVNSAFLLPESFSVIYIFLVIWIFKFIGMNGDAVAEGIWLLRILFLFGTLVCLFSFWLIFAKGFQCSHLIKT